MRQSIGEAFLEQMTGIERLFLAPKILINNNILWYICHFYTIYCVSWLFVFLLFRLIITHFFVFCNTLFENFFGLFFWIFGD